jgi:hypothetical protein
LGAHDASFTGSSHERERRPRASVSAQPATAYHFTHYASGNLVWQLRKRLSVGAEVLYGMKQTKGGTEGDAFRFQLGLLYSIFD